jgi:hypothetical protein
MNCGGIWYVCSDILGLRYRADRKVKKSIAERRTDLDMEEDSRRKLDFGCAEDRRSM